MGQGKCQPIGCDKRLGSTATENECGVCHGKPGDCTVASRHYSGAPRPRKHWLIYEWDWIIDKWITNYWLLLAHRRVVVIPRGARNIRIKEEPNSSNRLALKPRNSQTWILNGTFPIIDDVTKLYFIASGARFSYHSVFGQETMRAKGPLLSDVALMVTNFLWAYISFTEIWSKRYVVLDCSRDD